MSVSPFRAALGSLAIQLEDVPNSPLKDVVGGIIEALDDHLGGGEEETEEGDDEEG